MLEAKENLFKIGFIEKQINSLEVSLKERGIAKGEVSIGNQTNDKRHLDFIA